MELDRKRFNTFETKNRKDLAEGRARIIMMSNTLSCDEFVIWDRISRPEDLSRCYYKYLDDNTEDALIEYWS